uniref:RDD family protein n=1 Tax=Flavobacterium sp. TaxID=239 RepID=UPI00404B3865
MKSILENRITAVVVDYLIMGIIGFLLYVLTNDLLLSILITYPMAMNKDFLNGKSIGKRLFGIQVQDLKNNKATEWNCSLRNFLLIIPIEFVVIFMSPARRIGDRIAKTKIGIETTYNLKTIGSELKNYRITKEFIIGIVFGIANIYALLGIYSIILS